MSSRNFRNSTLHPGDFHVDYESAHDRVDGRLIPNWREQLICQRCFLKNRLRATVHLLEAECGLAADSRIYVTEQSTPFFRWLTSHYRRVAGSETWATASPAARSAPTA